MSSNEHINVDRARALAAEYGLVLRGGVDSRAGDSVPACEDGQEAGVLLLFGQTGSSLWAEFSRSAEYRDGDPDPLDRWSCRVGKALALELGGTALFPFEGPPWLPFGQWAQRAENLRSSPLGILMHPEYGLWHAYRFAIVLPAGFEGSGQWHECEDAMAPVQHACDRCQETPCLQACPVNAFTEKGYDVAACVAHLSRDDQSPCHRQGCLARGACPEARHSVYDAAHHRFHLEQFCLSIRCLGRGV